MTSIRQLKVLIADDGSGEALLCEALQEMGCSVDVARGVKEAMDFPRDIQRQDQIFKGFDLIICASFADQTMNFEDVMGVYIREWPKTKFMIFDFSSLSHWIEDRAAELKVPGIFSDGWSINSLNKLKKQLAQFFPA